MSGCNSDHEMWKLLEVTHEGTNQVKESKLAMLVRDYELFMMKQNESISEMFTRFTNITNGLKAYGKEYTRGEVNRKVLDALPKAWQPKTLAIEESKDLRLLPIEELIGSLLTYEMKIKRLNEMEDED
ncbi:MAG: hypothetical protein Q8784_02515 [Vigna little leaf phytoplasma]|nr:hypothetical protein [Vigna little leaf phytoplasma]